MKIATLPALLAAAALSLSVHAGEDHHGHGAHGEDHAHGEAEAAAGPFAVRGIFLGHDPSEGRVTLAHEAIPDVMMAMRMHLFLPEGEAVPALEPGDKVAFQLYSRIDAGQRWYAQGFEPLPEGTELTLPDTLREAIGH